MPPKKPGKKTEVVDLPKSSTLPDGLRNYFVGGWSSNEDLTSITTISNLVKPANEEAESTAPQVNILVLPGALKHAEDATVVLTHGLNIKGLLPQQQAANKAAAEARRNPKSADAAPVEEEADNNAGGDGGNDAAKAEVKKRKVIFANDAVQIHGSIRLQGIKPYIVVAPIIEQVKAVVAEKGAKKKTDEDKAREAEAQRQREEAALRVAKEEEERLYKYALPRRWPTVNISNLSFFGPVSVVGVHINFISCNFLSLDGSAASPMAVNQVEVNQYCKVSFIGCTFAQPARSALYVFPLADVTVKNSVFSGVDQPHSEQDVALVQKEGPSASALENARSSRPEAVGIHADSAKVLVDDCWFEALGTGVIFRGKYALAPPVPPPAPEAGAEKSASSAPKTATSMTLQKSEIRSIFGTGVFVDKATGVLLSGNATQQCGYYGAQFRGAGRVQVLRNTFSDTVLIHEGSTPFLHSNTMSTALVDKNDKGPVYMEPKY